MAGDGTQAGRSRAQTQVRPVRGGYGGGVVRRQWTGPRKGEMGLTINDAHMTEHSTVDRHVYSTEGYYG
jgi:hypothetical protein